MSKQKEIPFGTIVVIHQAIDDENEVYLKGVHGDFDATDIQDFQDEISTVLTGEDYFQGEGIYTLKPTIDYYDYHHEITFELVSFEPLISEEVLMQGTNWVKCSDDKNNKPILYELRNDWRKVVGLSGAYEVNSQGKVRSLPRKVVRSNGTIQRFKGTVLSIFNNSSGYPCVRISDSETGKRFILRCHRAVAEAFIPNPDNKPEVNHIDGDKKNNRVENLEWCTYEENNKHAWRTGLCDKQKKPVISISREGFGHWYPSIQSTRFYDCNPSLVHNAITGRQKSHRGMVWCYANNSEYMKLKEQQER